MSLVQEMDTALAERQLELAGTGNVPLPSNIDALTSVVLATDNNDILEDTPTGANTTHCTNSILVHRPLPSVAALPSNQPHERTSRTPHERTRRTHSRSIHTPLMDPPARYVSSHRQGPGQYCVDISRLTDGEDYSQTAQLTDLAWMVARLPAHVSEKLGANGPSVPDWAGFNAALCSQSIPSTSKIGYLPVINAPSTQLSTCKKVLDMAVNISQQTKQQDIVVVADQAIYAKLQEILWHDQVKNAEHPERAEFKRVVARMGTFHIICTLLAIIGKRYGDAGLRDILVEANIVSAGSLVGVLEGKHYNRSVKAHQIVAEAFERLRWQEFEEWTRSSELELKESDLDILYNMFTKLRHSQSMSIVTELIEHRSFTDLNTAYSDFCKQDRGPMSVFWTSYLDMVDLLRRFIRASRQAEWHLHLQCVRELLPWLFAYDRTNYCRYLSAYWCEMVILPSTHPDAYSQMERGEFAVQRSRQSPFAQVPVDQALEQTINRDTKVNGGIIGFSLHPGAVQRWMLTAHLRAALTESCKDLAGMLTDSSVVHKSLRQAAVSTSHKLVENVSTVLQSWANNPFAVSNEIYCLSSGIQANDEVQADLPGAHEKGYDACKAFFVKRLLSKSEDYHARLKSLKLKTFATQMKSSKITTAGRQTVLKAHCNLFAQLAVVAQAREFNMHEVLLHELGPFPYSLATLDGGLMKTSKAKLLPLLEKDVATLDSVPSSAAYIVDAMAALQATIPAGGTFGCLAEQILNGITYGIIPGGRVDFVSDQYPHDSIKSLERQKRGSSGMLLVTITAAEQRLPTWKKFMAASPNKVSLISFLINQWKMPRYAQLLKGKSLYVTLADKCERLTSTDGTTVVAEVVAELQSQQEEADTRLFLHAYHAASSGYTAVIVKSPDTDVAVIGAWAASRIPAQLILHTGTAQLILHTGTAQRSRYISLSNVTSSHGSDLCDALPGLHAFTGCDTVSSFSRRGKYGAFKLVKSGHAQAMQRLGESLSTDDDLIGLCEQFVCRMYRKESFTSVNALRYHLFCTATTKSYADLPPTHDALVQHVRRSNFQAYLWKRCLHNGEVPSPKGHGWDIKDNDISIVWTTLPAAPLALLELLRCGCLSGCSGARCRCFKNNVSCTDACQCKGCTNNTATTGAVTDADIEDDNLILDDEV